MIDYFLAARVAVIVGIPIFCATYITGMLILDRGRFRQ